MRPLACGPPHHLRTTRRAHGRRRSPRHRQLERLADEAGADDAEELAAIMEHLGLGGAADILSERSRDVRASREDEA